MSIRPYGAITWLERLKMVLSLLPFPVVMVYRLLISPFTQRDRHKTWGRVLADFSFRFSSSSLTPVQIQSLLGTDSDVYRKWAGRQRHKERVEDLGEGASLMWLSEKFEPMEKVILYIHGGCYCLPMQDFAADFWKKHVDAINECSATGRKVGLVALQYSLIPTASFPVPLKQMVLAIQYLLEQGIKPENIHLFGESAGGGMVLQLLSHLLHPIPDGSVPKVELPSGTKLGSVCIMSPLVKLTTDAASYETNSDLDILPKSSWTELYDYARPFMYPDGSEGAFVPYTEAARAPEGWFSDANRVVSRVWLSVGEYEGMLDDDLAVMAMFMPGPEGDDEFLTTYVEPKGVHVSHYLDNIIGESGLLATKVVEWVTRLFNEG